MLKIDNLRAEIISDAKPSPKASNAPQVVIETVETIKPILIICKASIPIAFCLSKWLGAKGVWHAFWISEVVVCGISYLLYRKFFAVKNREIDQVI